MARKKWRDFANTRAAREKGAAESSVMKTQITTQKNHLGGITLAAYFADPPPAQTSGLTITRFRDRKDAGERLGEALGAYANRADIVVLGLPRGGVPVAAEVARKLSAPLDTLVVRKLGVPFHRELGMGAIASGSVRIINKEVVNAFGISAEAVEEVAREEQRELERREKAYRGELPPVNLEGKTVFIVDDGIATGSTMLAAVEAVRHLKAARVVVAVP
ncbi:MAG TPA: phosphoribosyltransferase family protein, partial [Candidatus Limnocylindrales bacterium]|nr:phosphoribosyltransferase family protein [Candidatus Limnocylindrales bacterium]